MSGKGMNWQRVHWETQAQRYGSSNVLDEKDRLDKDRAAKWLGKVGSKPAPQGVNHTLKRGTGTDRKKRKAERRRRKRRLKAERRWCGKQTVVIPGDGDPCPRCYRPMQVREHGSLSDKVTSQPFYYSRWFCCMYADCKTNMVMPERYKVERPVVWGESWDQDTSGSSRLR